MGTDGGRSVLNVTGAGDLLLDQQFPKSDGHFDTTLHYVVKSTSADPVNLWLTMATPSGIQSYVGCSTDASGGVQNVQFWTGDPPHVVPFNPVVLTGFDANAYLTIDVTYQYATSTFSYTVTDGTTIQSAAGIAFTGISAGVLGNGGSFTIQSQVYAGKNIGSALIDQLNVTVAGCTWYGVGDFQPDGSVDMKDLTIMSEDWLLH
jgi:hypothetical protein